MIVFAIVILETQTKEGTDRLGCWARKWDMRFQSIKCNIMQITRKRTSKTGASYTLEGTVLENVDSVNGFH